MTTLTRLVVGMSRLGDHLLKRKASGIIVAALAFACGAGLAYGLKVKQRPSPKPPAPPATAAATTTPPCATPATAAAEPAHDDDEYFGPPALEAWKNRHSGSRLHVDFDPGGDWGRLSESKVEALPYGRMLVAKDFYLYLFEADGRVLWRYEMPETAIDFVHVEATGVVCGTAQDNNMFILDAATGKELEANSRQGRGGYGAVHKYGGDVCLIEDALGEYNADYRGGGPPMQDGVEAWRGTRMLWQVAVPPDAELQVVGSKIYAVTKTRTRILVKEIKPPKSER